MKKIIFPISIFLFAITLQAQWVEVGPANSSDLSCTSMTVYSLSVNGSKIFAGGSMITTGAVFASTDSGSTWTPTALNNQRILSVGSYGNNLFAGTNDSGVYVSTDDGSTWSRTSLNNRQVWCFAQNGNTVFAGTSTYGLYATTNNGVSWTNVLSGQTTRSLLVNGNNIIAGGSMGIYVSTNGGTAWTQTSSLYAPYSFAASGNYVYAGIYATGSGIAISTNNGLNWASVFTGFDQGYAVAATGNYVFAGTAGGIFLSTNNGQNWTQSLMVGLTFYSLAFIGNNIIAGSYAGCFYRSTNNGTSWQGVSNINNYRVNALAMSNNNILVGTGFGTNSGNGIFLSTNGGINWSFQLNDRQVFSLAASGSNVYAGTDNGPYFSLNSGNTWIQLSITPTWIFSIALNNNYIFAGSNGGIYRSTNNGANWVHTLSGNVTIDAIIATGNYVVAGSNYPFPGPGIYRSTDNGSTWAPISLYNQIVYSLALSGNNIFAGIQTLGVFVSTNFGANWTSTSLNNQTVLSLAANGNAVLAGTANSGVYLSTDNGQNWTLRNEGMGNIVIRSLLIGSNYIYAGSDGHSTYRRLASELIGITQISNQVPMTYAIEQNYPNPFNASTKFKIQIPKLGNVKVNVFDILGREVAALVNEQLKPGTYEVEWDATNFPSGVYYYKLIVGDFTKTKKMVVIK